MRSRARPRTVLAPAVAPAVALLANRIPGRCPDDGCRSRHIAFVAGGDDRGPIGRVTFACGHVVSVPGAAP